jgi:hypothetical protein
MNTFGRESRVQRLEDRREESLVADVRPPCT